MEAFLISAGVVALAEIGDKTQLFALMLAARYRRPLPIIGGVLIATLASLGAAGAVGTWLGLLLTPRVMHWALIVSFVSMAIWLLVPERPVLPPSVAQQGRGLFLMALIGFFVLEIGDKTQIATIALAAKYRALTSVVAGTTLGMMAVNVPAVLLGHVAGSRLPLTLVRGVAAALCVGLAIAMLFGAIHGGAAGSR
ncbi:MAG TPA: TMEM165/GDT1 family protein [Steroidobacteraceae bacterium]